MNTTETRIARISMKKLYDIEITVCPDLLSKQKHTLLAVIELLVEREDTDDVFINHLDGLINMLDAIEDQINDIAH
jgi:hypothetical protein